MRKMRRARAEGKLGRTQGTHARRRVKGGWRALRRELAQTFDEDALDSSIGRPAIVWWLRKLELREKKKRGPR